MVQLAKTLVLTRKKVVREDKKAKPIPGFGLLALCVCDLGLFGGITHWRACFAA